MTVLPCWRQAGFKLFSGCWKSDFSCSFFILACPLYLNWVGGLLWGFSCMRKSMRTSFCVESPRLLHIDWSYYFLPKPFYCFSRTFRTFTFIDPFKGSIFFFFLGMQHSSSCYIHKVLLIFNIYWSICLFSYKMHFHLNKHVH